MIAQTLVFTFVFVACFFAYGVGRTMVEAFGVSAMGIIAGSLLCVLVIIPLTGGVVLYTMRGNTPRLKPIVLTTVIAMALAVMLSEANILADEVVFAKESVAPQYKGKYSRARHWPNGDAGLVYDAGRGFWATD